MYKMLAKFVFAATLAFVLIPAANSQNGRKQRSNSGSSATVILSCEGTDAQAWVTLYADGTPGIVGESSLLSCTPNRTGGKDRVREQVPTSLEPNGFYAIEFSAGPYDCADGPYVMHTVITCSGDGGIATLEVR